MKILAIRGKNLASLAGEFEVDFRREPLLNAGLFAISGSTGAGKSTLLDALCLALYGNTPRLSQASGAQIPDVHDDQVTPSDPRTLLRRNCGEGYAEVDFVGIDGIACRARWTARRARGRGDGRLQNIDYQLIRIADQQPLSGTKKGEVHAAISQRVGLSFNQFTRAVLLAQNDFATFLKADDNERAQLLQTLTGSERFERLSIRVFERFGLEKQALDALNRQLADAPPLEDNARTELEVVLKQARDILADREQKKLALEVALRWHQTLAGMETAIAQAQTALDRASLAQQDAAPRRAHLAHVSAVEPARPLHAECTRLSAETQLAGAELKVLVTRLAAAEQARLQAEAALTLAQQNLQAAGKVQKQMQPEIEKARNIDTEIGLLEPLYQSAKQVLDAASAEVVGQTRQQQTLTEQQAQTTKMHSETTAWLSTHTQHAALAENWKHSEYLLLEAEKTQADKQAAEGELQKLQQAEKRARADAAQQATKLTVCVTTREQAEADTKAASERCARFNPDDLAQQKAAAEALRNRLQNAQTSWTQWQERQRECASVENETAALRLARQTNAATQQLLLQQRPGLEGQLQQAERALQRALAACNQDVDGLRATLVEGEACPVCGAAEHPYAESGATHRLHELLKEQQADQTNLRRALDKLLKDEASQNATLAEQDKQLAKLDAQLLDLARRCEDAYGLWQTEVQKTELDPATTDVNQTAAWLTSQTSAIDATLQNLIKQETELRADQKARDAALASFAQAQAAEQLAREAGLKARETLSQSVHALQTAQQQIAQANRALAANLDQLDSVLTAANWRQNWASKPANFRLACQNDAEAWLQQHKAQAAQSGKLDELNGQLNVVVGLLAKAGANVVQTRTACEQQAAQLQSKRQTRAQLLGGKPAAEVEAELARSLETAQAAVNVQEKTTHDARISATQAATTRELADKQLAALQAFNEQATAKRAAWLLVFNTESAIPLDLDSLLALLQLDPHWLNAERNALAGIDKAVDSAVTVLKERQGQRSTHLAQAHSDKTTVDLEAELAEMLPLLSQEKAVVAEQEFALRRDDERRKQAAGVIEQMRAQNARTETWARLNEMIGSATGSKFRRIAQQYTLDVLLGYANRHLADLSRRYRLERMPDSLTLLVVDQDMGDERRSVHSLSGGESFLVSLALALGLASLSSHSVKVESLFIDEGFGSLDAETLSVAMDALDKLQTQGRKVGVISHVHEMAERIGVQIQVTPQSGGQSRLTVIG